MHRFYINEENSISAEDVITITGESYNHLVNVLRLGPGDEIIVGNSQGLDYICEIRSVDSGICTANVTDCIKNAAELPIKITLFQGVPKGDKLELVIQKAVELGACEVVPVLMKRTVVKVDEKKAGKKIARYQSIAENAGKQSGRGVIPTVGDYMTFRDAIAAAKKLDRILLPYEDARGISHARNVIDNLKKDDVNTLGIFIGPEGGFAEEEVELAKEAGAEIITLGKRILRTETAGLAILSIIGFLTEEDDS